MERRTGKQFRLSAAAGAAVCLLTAGAAAWLPSAAQASPSLTFTVNTTADAHDARPGDGKCADAAGQCTLRAALEEADASPQGSTVTITMPSGRYDLSLGSLILGSATAPLNIRLDGAGSPDTVVTATGRFRVLLVTGYHTTASLVNLQLTGGKAGPNSYGGGIFNQGTLTLRGDALTGDTAGAGGGVANAGGTLAVGGSSISDNNGGGFGGGGIQNGGPQNLPGTVVVESSVIFGNVTSNEGGGIFSGQNGRPAARAGPRSRPAGSARRAAVRPHGWPPRRALSCTSATAR